MQMRSDYSFYTLAIVFFMVAVVSAWTLAGTFQIILISISVLLGMISLGFGLTLRSKSLQTNQTPPTASPQEITQTEPSQTSKIENLPPPPIPMKPETSIVNPPAVTTLVSMETELTTIQTVPVIAVPAMLPEQPSTLMSIKQSTLPLKETALTDVRGIGQKRANKLKTLDIKTAEDLANASIEDLAKKLKISSKNVAKWIASAKELTKNKE
jgi:predicted flap endonuclease-1-like 5' DNA nuclease